MKFLPNEWEKDDNCVEQYEEVECSETVGIDGGLT